MKKEDLRIIFMGTPEFAVGTLKALVEGGYNVVAVVTQPDKAVGRHHDTLQPPEVKRYALEHGFKEEDILQPEKMKDPAFVERLRSYRADLQVVVAFRMLPEVVWAMPRFGTFNVHAALLPQYRGAAPINWAIINGEEETGVTTFFLDQEIDTGRIILQERTPITPDDNAGDIHDRLMLQGAALVLRTVRLIESGQAESREQNTFLTEGQLRPAPKIFKETCRICWRDHTLQSAHNFIRGLSPYPAAWVPVVANGRKTEMKIFRSTMLRNVVSGPTGELLTDDKSYLRICLPGGMLALEEVQLSGKKRMSVADLMRGTKIRAAD